MDEAFPQLPIDPHVIPPDQQVGSWLDLLLTAGAMKNLPRSGWRLVGINPCESVADHSFRVVLIAMMLGELVEGVDSAKLLQMAVLHELPESLLTDLPLPAVQVMGRDAKYRAESDAWSLLLPAGERWQCWKQLWQEFEACRSPEARLTRVADKLEMLIQAYEYQRAGYRNLDNFWSEENFQDFGFEVVRLIWSELKKRRAELQ